MPRPRNDGFTIEDASHNQASPSNATLSSPSQPRSILPLLPNRSNISSRPLTTVAINSTITDHIHSRRSTPLMNLGIRVWHFDSDICQVLSSKIVYGFLLPVFGCYLQVLWCSTPAVSAPTACSGCCASNTEQRLPYWNLFPPPVAPKSNPNADITAASPRTRVASPHLLPPPALTLLAGVQCYLCSGDDLELSGVVLKLPIFISLSKGDSIVRFLLAGTSHCSKL
ncbi:hypothetical protein BHE74_00033842 [Ensete ventricosum]|nr:hypothetical protein BHE74_00033842 [Ensete ventricosum]